MQGTINITAIHHDDGPQIITDVDLSNVGFQDKTFLINAFLKGLQIPPTEAAIHLLAIRSGLVNSEDHEEEVSNE